MPGSAAWGRSGRVRARPSWRLPKTVAFYLQVSMLVSLLGAASAPTPLYRVYQSEWGFSPIAITVVFGVYALAVLGALLTVGSLSDHIGRRPVLLSAVAIQVASLIVFTTAGSVTDVACRARSSRASRLVPRSARLAPDCSTSTARKALSRMGSARFRERRPVRLDLRCWCSSCPSPLTWSTWCSSESSCCRASASR